MASIKDLYDKSDFSKLPRTGADKTPISKDDFDLKELSKDEKALKQARGGKLNQTPYSSTIEL
tara:strand:- start:2080 stop:2268 length:189 start_codon:yes stop_codon:yes gene_type:complete